jgi:hypothetical protein
MHPPGAFVDDEGSASSFRYNVDYRRRRGRRHRGTFAGLAARTLACGRRPAIGRQSAVGLALSQFEGALFASIENLFWPFDRQQPQADRRHVTPGCGTIASAPKFDPLARRTLARVGDRRIWLIAKWSTAGVLEDRP